MVLLLSCLSFPLVSVLGKEILNKKKYTHSLKVNTLGSRRSPPVPWYNSIPVFPSNQFSGSLCVTFQAGPYTITKTLSGRPGGEGTTLPTPDLVNSRALQSPEGVTVKNSGPCWVGHALKHICTSS